MLSPFGSFLFISAFEKVLPLQSCKTFSAQNGISLRHLKKLMWNCAGSVSALDINWFDDFIYTSKAIFEISNMSEGKSFQCDFTELQFPVWDKNVPPLKTEKRKLPGFPLQSFAGLGRYPDFPPCRRPCFRSIFFPHHYSDVHLFLIKCIEHF